MPSKRKRRIFRALIASFLVSFLVLVAVALYALRQINANNLFSAQVDHTNTVLSELYQLDILVRDLDIQERGYMLTQDSLFLIALQDLQKQMPHALEKLKSLTSDNKKQKEIITQLRGTLALRVDAIKENIADYQANTQPHTNPSFFYGRKLKLQALAYIKTMQKNEYSLLVDRYKQKKSTEKIAQNIVQNLIITFFIITLVLFLVMIREIYIRKNFQEELQRKINDLKQSNEELEQITYALTHDVQEPLRKIQIFSDKLLYTNGEQDKVSEIVHRLNRSAGTVQILLEDMEVLLGLRGDQYEEQVILENVLHTLLQDMKCALDDKKAIVSIDPLPIIKGNYKQLQLLFRNLLDNSLKFHRSGAVPSIKIKSTLITDEESNAIATNEGLEYYKLTLEDNGVGFDNAYTDKIFKIFQRLHDTSEYAGKGIGLAICQRIMNNHKGIITAYGEPDKGAIFTLYFPKN